MRIRAFWLPEWLWRTWFPLAKTSTRLVFGVLSAEANVAAGEMIEKGDLLFVREAMKMEMEITTPIGGKVKEVKVNLSDSAKSGQVVLLCE
jgi:biotin carboxyl carrier protein